MFDITGRGGGGALARGTPSSSGPATSAEELLEDVGVISAAEIEILDRDIGIGLPG